jgi:O-antigen ligase
VIEYQGFYKVMLALSLAATLALSMRPLLATTYVLWFRAAFAVAAYLQVSLVDGLPFFVPLFVTFSASLFLFYLFRLKKPLVAGPAWVLLGFLLLAAINAIGFGIAEESDQYVIALLRLILPFPIYFGVSAAVQKDIDLRKLGPALAIIMVAPITVGIWQAITGVSYEYTHDRFVNGIRPVGTIVDPNSYGIFLSISALMILPFAMERGRTWPRLLVLAAFAAVLLSRNRGSWIALFVAFSVGVPFFFSRIRVRRWLGVAAAASLVAAPIVVDRFKDLGRTDEYGRSQDTFTERVEQSRFLFSESLRSPLYGYGAGSSEMTWKGTTLSRPPHNDYLRVLYEFGFPALLLYLAFICSQLLFCAMRARHSSWRYQLSTFLVFLYVGVISLSQNLLYDTVTFGLILFSSAMSHGAYRVMSFKAKPSSHPPAVHRPTPKAR